ncbi:MarR family winged helix-turn-helix transcriptional regulator [Archangium violaceum]|uniref:MarR family winged helix-turn-helix transcriptional regulator n=1 Tax=Archangium violaceum TaxID=83451 RepID=UPI001EEF8D75|nr:MarR family transcriptional regulator [Archangium violaceum]
MARRLGERTSRPFTQLLALKVIAEEHVQTQAALAEHLLMDAPAVSRLVDRLENDGLVKRCAGENRRCVRLQATEAAEAEVSVLREAVQWVDNEAGRYLTLAEMQELKRLLDKLIAGLAQGQEIPETGFAEPEGEPR